MSKAISKDGVWFNGSRQIDACRDKEWAALLREIGPRAAFDLLMQDC